MSAAILRRLQKIKQAARELRSADGGRRDAVLLKAAELLKSRESEILRANEKDLKALGQTAPPAFRDRLTLTPSRLAQMSESLRAVAALANPVGEEVDAKILPNGLKL